VPESSQIAFEQAGLGSVLRQNKLVVPANQRDYAWTDREVTQLFQDLAKAKADAADYFLGAVVTIPGGNETLEVVDGQQRLATTAILLAAFREYLATRHEQVLVESINNEFLTSIDRATRTRVPNLRLNVDDNDLFRRIVVGEVDNLQDAVTRTSHQLIMGAYNLAKAQVRYIVQPLDPKDHGDIINDWVSFIENKALVVLLRVPDSADAYKMFETLNARGLETSQADLIKNFLFGRAGERLPEVQSRWGYMRGALEALDEDDITVTFLRQALIVMKGHVREAEVFDIVEVEANSVQSAVTLTAKLEDLSNLYVATFNPQHERWTGYPDQSRRAIEVFNLLNIRPLRPLILSIADKFESRSTGEAFQFLISLGVRLFIASSTRSGSVEQALATVANQIYTDDVRNLGELKEALSGIMPRDEAFQVAFSLAKVSNQRLARYYLRSLEMTAKGEREPWFVPQEDRTIITLEHVLPRRPGSGWTQFTEDEARNFATRLGNLVLLRASSNSRLGNESFSAKKAILAESPYVLTNMAGNVESWTPSAIQQRQERLAELAVRTWPR
jgi:uncharacterized protein DUF262/uncharacterized protein DUF1524